jgi:hypothetical protein
VIAIGLEFVIGTAGIRAYAANRVHEESSCRSTFDALEMPNAGFTRPGLRPVLPSSNPKVISPSAAADYPSACPFALARRAMPAAGGACSRFRRIDQQPQRAVH